MHFVASFAGLGLVIGLERSGHGLDLGTAGLDYKTVHLTHFRDILSSQSLDLVLKN